MEWKGTLQKYLFFIQIGFKQGFAEKGATLGRLGFYAIILLIFSRIWTVTYAVMPEQQESNPTDLLWYLAITEWIVISTPLVYLQIEKDVRSGDIAYFLNRPVSYVGMKIFEGFGHQLFRMCVLGLAGIFFAGFLSGGLPTHLNHLILIFPLGVLAGLISILFQASVGLTAFWIQDATPIFWLWQKCWFVLGGLMIPLSFYPASLRVFSEWSPFSALLYWPAHAALSGNINEGLVGLGLLIFWGFWAIALLLTLYKRGVRVLNVNGG